MPQSGGQIRSGPQASGLIGYITRAVLGVSGHFTAGDKISIGPQIDSLAT